MDKRKAKIKIAELKTLIQLLEEEAHRCPTVAMASIYYFQSKIKNLRKLYL